MATAKEKALIAQAELLINEIGFNKEDYVLTGDKDSLEKVVSGLLEDQKTIENKKSELIEKANLMISENKLDADKFDLSGNIAAIEITIELINETIESNNEDENSSENDKDSVESEVEVEEVKKPTLAELTKNARKVYNNAKDKEAEK